MLAYYINLIQQQEKAEQDSKGQKPGPKKAEDERETLSERKSKKPVEKPDEPMEEVKRTRRSLSEDDSKIARKPNAVSSQDVDDNSTPRKTIGAKALAQQEADRIISTILERRPGRAEFAVPSVEDPKKRKPSLQSPPSPDKEDRSTRSKRQSPPTVTESPAGKKESTNDSSAPSSLESNPIHASEGTVDNRIKKKKSLAEIEAERIIATIKSKDEERMKNDTIMVSAPLSPVIAPSVSLIEPRPRGRKPNPKPTIVESSMSEPVRAPVKQPTKPQVAPKQPTSVSAKSAEKEKVALKRTESVNSTVSNNESSTSSTFRFHHKSEPLVDQWWRKKVSLCPIEYEEELQSALARIEADYQSLDESDLRVRFIA